METYVTIVKTLEVPSGIPAAKTDEFDSALAKQVQEILDGLPNHLTTLYGRGWNMISHDIARIDQRLTISFIIRVD
ncbi:hypothetical protein ACFLX3_03155 [Chloroflexota bacterium]